MTTKKKKGMRKSFFFAFAAIVAAFAFTSCEPNEQGGNNSVTAEVSLKDKALELSIGEETRLTAVLNPSDANVELEWTSSNDTVASVSNAGLVKALSEGEAVITVKVKNGESSAACKITVSADAVYNQFNIAGYGLFGQGFTPVKEELDTIEFVDGGSALCRLSIINCFAWDGDLLYTKGSGWSGAGLLMSGVLPVYVIEDNNYKGGAANGYYVGSSEGISIAECNGEYVPYTMQCGKLDVEQYGEFLKTYIVAETGDDVNWEALEAGVQGTTISFVDYVNDAEGIWYMDYGMDWGIVLNGQFNDDEALGIAYEIDLDWFDVTSDDRWCGLKVNVAEKDGKSYIESVVEPFDMLTISRHFTNVETELEAPKYFIGDMNLVHKELPSFVRSLPTDHLYMK